MTQKENVKIGEGGEILSAEITTIKKVSAEQFCQVYLQSNEEFFKLSKSEMNVLACCWYYSNYYDDKDDVLIGNKIIADKNFRASTAKKTGLKDGTIKNSITSLSNKDMLIKDENCKGTYYLNPKFFFKGRISDRTKAVKQVIEYQIN